MSELSKYLGNETSWAILKQWQHGCRFLLAAPRSAAWGPEGAP